MKKFLCGVQSSSTSQNLGLLFLRLMFGFGMLYGHGWDKLINFSDKLDGFPDPLGISTPVSLVAAVFAEVICAFLVGIGLFTRAALIPLIFTMCIAAFVHHGGEPFSKIEMALLYLVPYITLFLTGPGKYSLDKKLF